MIVNNGSKNMLKMKRLHAKIVETPHNVTSLLMVHN